MDINPDATFKYSWHFDLQGSWTKGTWRVNNDTVYFHMIPIYDTIRYKGRDNRMVDSLILSVDEKSGQITMQDAGVLYSGGQNIKPARKCCFIERIGYTALIKTEISQEKKERDLEQEKICALV